MAEHIFVRQYVGEDPESERYRASCQCGWEGKVVINRWQTSSDRRLQDEWWFDHRSLVEERKP